MTDKLLFQCRGKSAVTGGWVYGYPVPFPDGISGWALTGEHFFTSDRSRVATTEFEEVLYDTIGRFAGVADYFNNPVFEGDIVSTKPKMRGVVRFGAHLPGVSHLEKTAFGFYIEWSGPEANVFRQDVGYWFERRELVIRGNIYDNPELLEVST